MIDQLTKHPGWPVMVDWLHTRMDPLKKQILNGGIDSHDAYLEATGYCKGIHEILDAPKKVATLVVNEQLRREETRLAEDDAEVIQARDWA